MHCVSVTCNNSSNQNVFECVCWHVFVCSFHWKLLFFLCVCVFISLISKAFFSSLLLLLSLSLSSDSNFCHYVYMPVDGWGKFASSVFFSLGLLVCFVFTLFLSDRLHQFVSLFLFHFSVSPSLTLKYLTLIFIECWL